jgi:hypothetical protein
MFGKVSDIFDALKFDVLAFEIQPSISRVPIQCFGSYKLSISERGRAKPVRVSLVS